MSVTAFKRTLDTRCLVKILLIGACLLIALGGLGFIAVGGYVTLCEIYSPWVSGLIVGATALLLSLLAILLLSISMRNVSRQKTESFGGQAPEREARESAQVDNVMHLGEALGSHLSQRGVRLTDVALAALVAGTVLGTGPALQRRRQNRRRAAAQARHDRQ